ncbi:hypothetical protein JG687_00016911 [Phytophthora cactorum]|uniref:Uncharacterized protein n=1 Tax=Phytophthora cactorum TaxID=29920 RepID=A0A8T1TTV1_9STRA|nr:hypothetical protein JG687_00016911 [Phytophthora cactorum]
MDSATPAAIRPLSEMKVRLSTLYNQCVDSSVDGTAYEHTGQDAADQQPEADLPIRETHIESVLDEAGRKTPHDSACDEGGPWPNTSASL